MLVDFFPYFDPTGRAITELRIRMFEKIVDQFIIVESNRTHAGTPAPIGLRNLIHDADLPADKIRIIDLYIPEDDKLPIIDLDYMNCYEGNSANMNSVRARCRERMQKDAILQVVGEYHPTTYFIVSDQDEIINPEFVDWIKLTVDRYPNHIVKVPLVQLEGRADLRVHMRDTGLPRLWDASTVMVKQYHLVRTTPLLIRSCFEAVFPTAYITMDGQRVEDMGWHFSWMGGNAERLAKVEGFAHYDDKFNHLETGSFKTAKNLLIDMKLEDGAMPPSCNKNEVLRNYDLSKLPKEIFELPRVKEYLLP
jgi:hypothetical protein